MVYWYKLLNHQFLKGKENPSAVERGNVCSWGNNCCVGGTRKIWTSLPLWQPLRLYLDLAPKLWSKVDLRGIKQKSRKPLEGHKRTMRLWGSWEKTPLPNSIALGTNNPCTNTLMILIQSFNLLDESLLLFSTNILFGFIVLFSAIVNVFGWPLLTFILSVLMLCNFIILIVFISSVIVYAALCAVLRWRVVWNWGSYICAQVKLQ